MIFYAHTEKGKLVIHNREKFMAYIETDRSFEIKTRESEAERDFFHGAVIKLLTFFQERMDYKDYEDCQRVFEWVKAEFLPDAVVVNGIEKVVGGSTKGRLRDDLTDRVIEYMVENYGIDQAICLNPEEYKKWRDEIQPATDKYDDYIDYLVKTHRIKKPI